MVKSKLISAIAQKATELSEQKIEFGVKHILDAMSQTLIRNDRIEIRDFGSFKLKHHPPRKARNPKTGVVVTTPEKYSPSFRAGKELRIRIIESALNGKPIHSDAEDFEF